MNDLLRKKTKLSAPQQVELFRVLQDRFENNPARHPRLSWARVRAQLEARPDKLWSLAELEKLHHAKSEPA